MAQKLSGLKSIQPLHKENKTKQEASPGGRHEREPNIPGLHSAAGWPAFSKVLSPFQLWKGLDIPSLRLSHPTASCSSELMTFPVSQPSSALAWGHQERGLGLAQQMRPCCRRGNICPDTVHTNAGMQPPKQRPWQRRHRKNS